MNKRNNKKGFTLVELLAVIVVLAIIIVIAVPNVLSSMNNAKKKSFQLEAERLLESAQALYASNELMGNARSSLHEYTYDSTKGYCYTFDDLNLNPSGFTGFIAVNPSIVVDATTGVSTTGYSIFLTNGQYSYVGTEYKEVYSGQGIQNTDAAVSTVQGITCGS